MVLSPPISSWWEEACPSLLLVLEPLSQVFISLAIFFTVSRLKTEY
jgi:hypothetical protein